MNLILFIERLSRSLEGFYNFVQNQRITVGLALVFVKILEKSRKETVTFFRRP